MNGETRRLAILATIFFFPTALMGWWYSGKSEKLSALFFRISIYLFLAAVLLVGVIVVTKGGQIIKPMGSFF
jgi:heme A synthase